MEGNSGNEPMTFISAMSGTYSGFSIPINVVPEFSLGDSVSP